MGVGPFLLLVGPRDRAQIVRRGTRQPYLLSHLTRSYTTLSLSIQLDEWFHTLALMNCIVIGMCVLLSLWYSGLDAFDFLSRSSVAAYYGSSIFNVSHLRSSHTEFSRGWTLLQSSHWCVRVSVS